MAHHKSKTAMSAKSVSLACLIFASTDTRQSRGMGKRIGALMRVETPGGQQTQSHVVFLMNFADELQREVPGREIGVARR